MAEDEENAVKVEQGSWNPPGRSGRWRVSMLVCGLCLAAAGVAVYLWPQLIVWGVAGLFVLLGFFFVVSALVARGGGEARDRGDPTA